MLEVDLGLGAKDTLDVIPEHGLHTPGKLNVFTHLIQEDTVAGSPFSRDLTLSQVHTSR